MTNEYLRLQWKLFTFTASILSLIAFGDTAHSASTWSGTNNANWNDGANWDALPVPGDDLIFTGVTNTATNNNFTANTAFGAIHFDNTATAGQFELAGNAIVLGGSISTLGSSGGPLTQSISMDMQLNGNRTLTTATDNNLAITGIISEDASPRGLIKAGDGLLQLSGANTFTGGVTHTAGSLRVEDVSALGTGPVTLSGGRLVFVGDDNTTFANDIEVTASSTLVSDRFNDGVGANHTVGNLTIGNQTLTVDSSGGNSSSGTAFIIIGGTTTLNDTPTFQVDNTAGEGAALISTTGITGPGGFIKTGNGVMNLAGGTYNYAGNATLESGTIRVSSVDNLQNTTVMNGGALQLRHWNGARQSDLVVNAGNIILQRNEARTFDVQSITVTAGNVAALVVRDVNNPTSGTIHELITDNGITLEAGSTLRLMNSNGYEFVIQDPAGSTPAITLAGDATLDVRAPVTLDGPIEDAGGGFGVTFNSNDTTSVLVLGAVSDYGGDTLFRSIGPNTSHVQLGVADALPHGVGKGNIDMALGAGLAVLDLNGFDQTVNGLSDVGLGQIDNTHASNASVFTVGDNDGGGTFSGTIEDTGAGGLSLVKIGAGTFTFAGTGDYQGTTTVSAGTLQLGTQTALSNNTPASWTEGNISVAAGATLAFNVGGAAEFTSADIDTLKLLGDSGSGGFASGSRVGFDATNAPGGTFTYSTSIGDLNAGTSVIGVDVLGSGTLVFDQANTFSGGLNLRAGTLQAAHVDALSSEDITFSGGTLQYTPATSGTDWAARFQNSASAVSLDTKGENVTLTGTIDSTNTGGIRKSGDGFLTLAGANTFTGDVVLTGTADGVSRLVISNDSNLGDVNNSIVFDGPSNPDLQFTSSMVLSPTRTVFLNAFGGGDLIPNGATAVEVGGLITGDSSLRKSGQGTLNITSTENDFSGDVLVIAGTLQVASMADQGIHSSLGIGNRIQIGNGGGGNGVLEHTGTGNDTTNRQVQIGNGPLSTQSAGADIAVVGTGSLTFSATDFNLPQSIAIAPRDLVLGGSNTLPNAIQGAIVDNNTAGGGIVSIEKPGPTPGCSQVTALTLAPQP